MSLGVNFHNVVGTAAQLLGQQLGSNIANLGNTIANRWIVIAPWTGNTGNIFLGWASTVTKPTAGTPNGTDGILLVKGAWNFFRAAPGGDVNALLWVIGSAAGQDYDVFGF
jgi:hypothetical protein